MCAFEGDGKNEASLEVLAEYTELRAGAVTQLTDCLGCSPCALPRYLFPVFDQDREKLGTQI